jgi:hypothetical protein
MTVLDEYGVRNLDQSKPPPPVPTRPADDIDESDDPGDDEGPPHPFPPHDRSDEGDEDEDRNAGGPGGHLPSGSRTASGGGSSDTGAEKRGSDSTHSTTKRARQSSPNTSRLTSYVSNSGTQHDSDRGDEAKDNSSIDEAGVRRVLEFEKSCGRFPEEQPHTNPGFDVLSKDAKGEVLRRIEIKSIGGPWTDRGVLLSSTQFIDAQAHSDIYWMYVVEHAEDDDAAVIHRIHNPAGHVTKFGFDGGWRAIREPDLERDESCKPRTSNTRRLLGWNAGTDN